MNFLYNFNNDNSTVTEGIISASLIYGTNYNLKIHGKDLHSKDNASFLNEFPYVNGSGSFISMNSGDSIYLKICNPSVSTFKVFKPSIFIHDVSDNNATYSFVAFGGGGKP